MRFGVGGGVFLRVFFSQAIVVIEFLVVAFLTVRLFMD